MYHQFHQGTPDPALIAQLLMSATGPPSKRYTDSPSQGTVPEESPYFPVTTHVAKAISDFDMNRTLTAADLSRQLGHLRRESPKTNPQYSLSSTHKIFASTNGSTLLKIFGGRLRDIHIFLTEERFPEGWESRVRDQMGQTMFLFNFTVFRVELGIKEEVDQPLNLM